MALLWTYGVDRPQTKLGPYKYLITVVTTDLRSVGNLTLLVIFQQ